MTRSQFDLLIAMEAYAQTLSQRSLATMTGKSIGTINKTMAELSKLGYVAGSMVTVEGLAALEPHRVRRAVFIAAGLGERLIPITLSVPKPLVRVRGVRIIDTLLDAVIRAGIEEIYIVRGYLGEQFDQLLYKYPSLRFIDNPLFNETNNISSAFCAKQHLHNAYVFDADLLLHNPALISKYQYASNYLGAYTEKTDDWCLATHGGFITEMMIGGIDCYHMFGMSYWTEEDGRRLAEDIPAVFQSPGGKENFWDLVPLKHKKANYKVAIRPCAFNDLTEIDTLRELVCLDTAYRTGLSMLVPDG